MTSTRVFLYLFFVVILGCPVFADMTPDGAPPSRDQVLADQIVEKLNTFRVAHDRSSLVKNVKLEAAGRMHSLDMVERNFFSHTSPVPGRARPRDRVGITGYKWSVLLENLFSAQGFEDGKFSELCIETWSQSPGHLENMVDPRAVEIGVGVATNAAGETFVTAVFGRP